MHSRLTRRQFLAVAGGTALTIATGLKAYNSPRTTAPGQPPLVFTPPEHFFQQQIGEIPQIDADQWTLTVGGMVQRALILGYDELRQLPSVEMPCTLACISNRPGGSMIGQAVWSGVRLSGLLERAVIRPEARYARFIARDGYVTTLDLQQLENALVVYGMNSKPLVPEHGFPARLIVPSVYGYKMPKWITQIAVTETPYGGYWETHGWSQSGVVQTTSAIYSPRPLESVQGDVVLEGIAYAGDRSVAGVEVQIDNGDWLMAALSAETPHSWRAWRLGWTAPASGEYHVRVRATDGDGVTQSHSGTRPFPNGSNGIHEIIIRVR